MISPISSTSCILGSHSGIENGLPSLMASFIAVIASSLVLNVPIRCSVQYSLPHSSSVILIHKSYRIFIQLPFLITYCFIASFAFVLQRLRAKLIPLKMYEYVQRLPCVKGAVAVATEGLFSDILSFFTIPPSAFGCHLPLHKGGFR